MYDRKLAARVWPKVVVTPDGCWLWTGAINGSGYGSVYVGPGRWNGAHRVVWQLLRGPVPAGLQLDHLCRVRACVSVQHLEPVTCLQNVRRGAESRGLGKACRHGHPRAESVVNAVGELRCRTCENAAQRARRAVARG
jgi:hypothetical protein